MAIRKACKGRKGVGANHTDTYYFDVEKGKRFPLCGGCNKGGNSHLVSIKSSEYTEQMEFQESEYFKTKA